MACASGAELALVDSPSIVLYHQDPSVVLPPDEFLIDLQLQ
jgi:hypothetical protein